MSQSHSGRLRKAIIGGAALVAIATIFAACAANANASTDPGTNAESQAAELASVLAAEDAPAPADVPAPNVAADAVTRLTANMHPANQPQAASLDEIRALPASVVAVAVVRATPSIVAKYCAGTSLAVVDGPGYRVTAGPALRNKYATLHIGAYVDCKQGKLIYCVESGRILTLSQRLELTANLRSKGTTITEEVAFVVNNSGQTASDAQSAAVSVAVKYLYGDTLFTKDYAHTYLPELNAKSKSIAPLANKFRTDAKNYRGPLKLTTTVTQTPSYIGQPGTVVVKLVSTRTGKAWPNHSVSLHLSGGVASTTLPTHTNSQGAATVNFRPVSTSPVVVTASTSYTASVRVLVTVPSTTQQTLVSPLTATTKATTKVTLPIKRPVAPKVASPCTTACSGVAPVTVTPSCNAKGAATKQTVITVTNPTTKKVTTYSVSLAAGTCGSKTLNVIDRSVVCATDRYLLNGKYTTYVTAKTCIVVDCPPLPSVHITWTQQVSVSCPCGGSPKASVPLSVMTVTATKNTSHALQKLIVNGTVVRTWAPGVTPAPYVVNVRANAPQTVISGTLKLHGDLKSQVNLNDKSMVDYLQ